MGFTHKLGLRRHTPCYDWLSAPPVSNEAELLDMLNDLAENMAGLIEGVGEFALWLQRAGVSPEVVARVERAAESGGDTCSHLSSAVEGAEHLYGRDLPDFSKVKP